MPRPGTNRKNARKAEGWLYQTYFRSLVDAKVADGVPKEAQAKGIGITESSFTTWYSGTKTPGIKTLRLIAAYYCVALSSLSDDPTVAAPGVPVDQMNRLTPAKRMVVRCIADRLEAKGVTDHMAESIWKAVDGLLGMWSDGAPR